MPQIDLATLAVKADTTDLVKLDKALDAINRKGTPTEKTAGDIGKSFKTMGVVVAAGAGTAGAAIGALGVKGVNVFKDLEVRMVGVQKTTDFTATEMDAFGVEIDKISRKVPVATASLLDIAGVAGQLGIKGVDNVTKFTETVGKLSLATDIVGEEGAASIARLLNVTGEGIDTVDTFGAVLVALGNNSAATESEILGLATQVGQATSTFSVSSAEALAMGAAMKSLGVSAELGGSVVGRAMREIEAAINEGGESLENLSRVTGIAAGDLKEQFGENATVVFQRWVEGIGEMIEGGTSAAEALDMFNLRGEEALKVLPTMAVNSEQLAKALEIANAELETGAALNNEVAKASETLDAQLTTAQNILTDYASEIGENLAPTVKDVIADFKEWDKNFGELFKRDISKWIGSGVKAAVNFGKAITVIDEVLGIAFADWQIDWEEFVFAWEKGTLTLKSSFGLAFDGIKTVAAEGLENLAGNMATLPLIGDDIAAKFASASANIKESATASSEYEAELAKLAGAHEANVAALELYKIKQAESIELTFKSVEAAEEEEEQSTKTTDTKVDNEKRLLDAKERARKTLSRMREDEAREEKKATDEQLRLKEQLNVETKRLTEDEFWFKTWTLEQEVEKMEEVAGDDQELQDQIAAYHELKQDEILEDYNEKNQSIIDQTILNVDTLKDLNQAVVDAFIAGEDAKVAVADIAKDKLSDFAVESATKGIPLILEGLGQQVGAWVGLGTSQALTDGETWQEKLASGVGYLAQAGAAVLAGKYVGDTFADGGWIGRNQGGGKINEGSGTADDVFLGKTGKTLNYGMGGEFVVDKETTQANLGFLNWFNGQKKQVFADGGMIADPRAAAENMNNNGFDIFADSVVQSRGNWKKAIIESVAWYVGSGLGMAGGKVFGKNIYADGGEIPVDIDDVTTTGGGGGGGGRAAAPKSADAGIQSYIDLVQQVIEEAEKADVGDISEYDISLSAIPWDNLWEWLRERGGRIGEIISKADNVLVPFMRDVFDPSRSVTGATFEEMIQTAYEDIVDELQGIIGDTLDPLGIAGGGENDDLLDDLTDPFDLWEHGGVLGMYRNGTDFVPKTGLYHLDEGEAVTPVGENIMAGGGKVIAELQAAVRELQKIVSATMESARIIRKFDNDGLPQERAF